MLCVIVLSFPTLNHLSMALFFYCGLSKLFKNVAKQCAAHSLHRARGELRCPCRSCISTVCRESRGKTVVAVQKLDMEVVYCILTVCLAVPAGPLAVRPLLCFLWGGRYPLLYTDIPQQNRGLLSASSWKQPLGSAVASTATLLYREGRNTAD